MNTFNRVFLCLLVFQAVAAAMPASPDTARELLGELATVEALLNRRERAAAATPAPTVRTITTATATPPPTVASQPERRPQAVTHTQQRPWTEWAKPAPLDAARASVALGETEQPATHSFPSAARSEPETEEAYSNAPNPVYSDPVTNQVQLPSGPCNPVFPLPPTALVIDRLTNGLTQVTGNGIPNRYYFIEARDDLSGMNWTLIGETPSGETGGFAFVDETAASRPNRFYRAVLDLTRAKALGYPNGFYDWSTRQSRLQEEIWLTDLGVYDESGNLLCDNYGTVTDGTVILTGYHMRGRYLTASVNSFGWPLTLIQPYVPATANDFRVPIEGNASFEKASAVLWSAQASLYHSVTDYRRRVLSPNFITELGLSHQPDKNLRHLQYREGGYSTTSDSDIFIPQKPILRPGEESVSTPGGGKIFPLSNNTIYSTRTRRAGGEDLPVITHCADPSLVVGEYTGLIPNWVSLSDAIYPYDSNCIPQYRNQNVVAPCLNDGINVWTAYTHQGDLEVFRTFFYNLRRWKNHLCDTNYPISTPPCDRGKPLDNVMMYEEGNKGGDQVFPFDNAIPLPDTQGPQSSDLAGIYFAAVFYDLALETGLGVRNANLLVFKTLSVMANTTNFTMGYFGDRVLEAGRLLWPGTNSSVGRYERVIAPVLASRGMPIYGFTNILDATYPGTSERVLPAPLGDASRLNPYNATARFGSLHPDKQLAMSPNTYNYGGVRILRGQYTQPDSDYDYMTYSLFKHSKYGPCDRLMFTDGTFSNTSGATFGEWNGDGNYLGTLTGRRLGNKTVFVPGSVVRYNHYRKRCDTEMESSYIADVHPFGWKAVQEMKNGFSFTVARVAESTNTVDYALTIVDPSLAMSGTPRRGPATYAWAVADFLGNTNTVSGTNVVVTLHKNEPYVLRVTRTRGVIVDTLDRVERANDLDREAGRAFVLDCLNPDGNRQCL